jgi:hypothetical protein
VSQPARRQQRSQSEIDKEALRQLRRDVTELLGQPAFRRYVAHLVYGRAGLKKAGAWKSNAEIHKVAAERDFAANILGELQFHAPKGFVLLEQEHVNRMAEELELLPIEDEEQRDE